MSLQDWLAEGSLAEHRATREEIASLLELADRDLQQCQTPGRSPDWKLAIAYNAAPQCATAALAAAGYRTTGSAHHYHTIQSLQVTLGRSAKQVSRLNTFGRKRHAAGYARAGVSSERDAAETLAASCPLADLP